MYCGNLVNFKGLRNSSTYLEKKMNNTKYVGWYRREMCNLLFEFSSIREFFSVLKS